MIDRRRLLALGSCGAAMGALPRLADAQIARTAKPAAPDAGKGAHDLTGTWTNAWYTKLERPKKLKTLAVTAAEAEAYEKPRRALHGELLDRVHDELGQNESEFPDNGPGLARIRGEIRGSWITDPADGRIPWTDAAKKRLYINVDAPDVYDNVENRDTDERCLTSSSATAPLVNTHDANVIEIVQTPDAVVLVGEKIHEARIIHIARPGEPDPTAGALPGWTGVSVGRWEGATLVVETTRLRPGDTKLDDNVYLTEHARVVERFTRTGPHEIAYLFEVEDPTLFKQVWRGEQLLRTAEGRMFEYACHEGNYSLPGILAGGQRMEREKAGK
jgi:hypothetical protein